MFVVIFRAQLNTDANQLDKAYYATAARLRKLAIDKYGCIEFSSISEGDEEVSLSYWNSEEDINTWKADDEHRAAQEKGRNKWYRSYQIEITKVERSYSENQ
ncbi:MAG: antibiotic biosynthesis monooxygenase [Proteobacteria bacterium]|nr:antibiotic biosynthesis monooxygenase [Pseudomonadota bacterium]